jgi:hypothetical protein
VLAFAVGVGISPIPIIAVVLMLFSRRARVNGPVFLLGWVAGLTTVFVVVVLVAGALDVGASDDADGGVSWLKIALGVALLVLAARKWRARPGPGAEPETPGWMGKVESFSPLQALGLALLLSVNPKNLVLTIGAATNVAQLDASGAEAVVAGAVFVLIGSAVVIGAVGYDLVGGARARSSLDSLKTWMTVHNSAVMAVLFAVFSAVLISEGIGLRT